MKCSGKQQLYPPDAEKLKKQTNEQKLIDVVNKAQSIGSPAITDFKNRELFSISITVISD